MDFVFYDQNYDYRAYFLGRKRVDFDVSSNLPTLNKMYGVVYQKQNWKIINHEVTTGGTAAINSRPMAEEFYEVSEINERS
jgi:hypothetical protein